ncbi:MAG: hypothetical protein CFE46_08535 [Burkholderiales bacterium PBB6]|nr:MAG: hypothetical protein CFE46_08535 [Burkholderiales bacterium PBB6]
MIEEFGPFRMELPDEAAPEGDSQEAAPSWRERLRAGLALAAVAALCALAVWLSAALQAGAWGAVLHMTPTLGLAVACVITWGRPAWLAVFVGVLLGEATLAVWAAAAVGPAVQTTAWTWLWALAWPVGSAAGTTWVAGLTARLLARRMRLPSRFLGLAEWRALAAVAALGSAGFTTLGLPAAALGEGLPASAWPAWWLSGWAGSFLMMMLVTPLVLLVRLPLPWRHGRRWRVLGTAVVGLALTAVAVAWALQWDTERVQARFRAHALDISQELQDGLARVQHHLQLLQAVSESPADQATRDRVWSLTRMQVPALVQLHWSSGAVSSAGGMELPPVPAAMAASFHVMALRAEMLATAPIAGPEGYTVLVSPVGQHGDQRLWGRLSVTEAMRSAHESWPDPGGLLEPGGDGILAGVRFRLSDITPTEPARVLHDTVRKPVSAPSSWLPTFRARPALPNGWGQAAELTERFDFLLGDRHWQLEVLSEPGFWPGNASMREALVAALGLLLTTLLTAAVAVNTGQREVLDAELDHKTRELDQSLMLLEDTVLGYQQQSEQLKLVLRATPAGFLAFGADDKVVFANEALANLLMCELEVLRALTRPAFADRVASQSGPESANVLRHLMADPAIASVGPVRVSMGLQDEQTRVLEISHSQVVGQAVQCVFLVVDVTQAVRLEQSKSQFIANAAHEIRTPLTSILGYSQLLARRVDMDVTARVQMHQMVIDKAQELNALLRNMLDLAELETMGRVPGAQQVHDLTALLQASTERLKPPAGRDAVVFELPEAPVQVMCCTSQIGLMLRHLVANAWAFSEPGTPVQLSLRVEATPGGASEAVLEVADQGIGMSMAESARAFERFYRADASGAKPGFGLGLCIVREVVALHGGSVLLDTAPDSGTRVRVRLPVVGGASADL